MKIAVVTMTLVFAGLVCAATAQGSYSTRKIIRTEQSSIAGREIVTAMHEYHGTVTEPSHTHPGDLVGYVLDGRLTLTQNGQAAVTLNAGDTFFVRAGVSHHMTSQSAAARILATYVVEQGKALAQ